MENGSARALMMYVAGLIAAISSALFVPVARTSDRASSAQIDRGRYLVKISGCNDCHTPGYAASAGQVEESRWLVGDRLGWQGPWGTTYPPNLRLLVQDITAEQWLTLARRPARPPMPWFALRDMTDADLLAIYHFARSLGPAGRSAPSFVPPGLSVSTPVVRVPQRAMTHGRRSLDR